MRTNDASGGDDLLLRLKQDASLLKSVLNIKTDGNHCPCPLCGDKTSLRVTIDSKNASGVWLWQCMKGCGQGTVIDALMKTRNMAAGAAIAELKRMVGLPASSPSHRPAPQTPSHPPPQPALYQSRPLDKQYPEPHIDQERAQMFVAYAHEELIERKELHKWLDKRKISIEVATKYRIGFLDSFAIKMLGKNGRPDFDWLVESAWVLPITNAKDQLMAVKLHFEVPQQRFKGKSIWMPFGTWPKHDRNRNIMPHHSYHTLWPTLQSQRKPVPKFEDIHNIQWWVARANADLRDEFNQALECEKLGMAHHLTKCVEDLTNSELEQCLQLAFETKRVEIQKYVTTQAIKKGGRSLDELNRYDFVVFSPGELKALAEISAGERATAITGGEGSLPPSHMFAVFQGMRVLIKHDDDIPWVNENNKRTFCSGRTFVHHLTSILYAHNAVAVKEAPHGRKAVTNV